MNQTRYALEVLLGLIAANFETLSERLPGAEVQKFRDAMQASENVLLAADPTPAPDDVPALPPFAQNMVDKFLAELDRRAEADVANAAIAQRTAVVLERIAAALEKAGIPAQV